MPPFVPRKRHRSPASPSERPPKRVAATAAKPKPSIFDTLDAPIRQTTAAAASSGSSSSSSSDDLSSVASDLEKKTQKPAVPGNDSDDDDDFDWEDAIPAAAPEAPPPSGDLEIEFDPLRRQEWETPRTEATDGKKKGPTKRDRERRVLAHKLHVQSLLWHNSIRNAWACDTQVQQTLVDELADGMKKEVERWRKAMGWVEEEEKKPEGSKKSKKNAGPGKKGKGAEDDTPSKKRATRDWGNDATRMEPGVPNLSGGDPLLRLLRSLSSYWKKRFKVTRPALRKLGHMDAATLATVTKSFEDGKFNESIHGMTLQSREAFRECAEKLEGSRDVGAQLFTALLRGLGIETRMVASLQPVGFGWSKAEEVNYKRLQSLMADQPGSSQQASSSSKPKNTTDAADLEDSSSELSDISELSIPTRLTPNKKGIDSDLTFPTYWVEALSPVSNSYIPADPLVRATVAGTLDLLSSFEPTGRNVDKSKQVIAYVVAYASDGSAKDVTIRYLKRRQLPGKTKAYRLPAEKIPIYNRKGKVQKYEEYDWFKRVMSSYTRPETARTAIDEKEDQGILQPEKRSQKSAAQDKPETLQFYKNSAEYVLERHFRREEALLPDAKPVKHFQTGKGEAAKSEPVYRRSDVVNCKTAESWHKEGREVCPGQQPRKFVPFRAVTTIRKREILETERESGEKATQGLYSKDQTQWIIPPPIEDGKIPRNVFGNMDVYVPSMVPQGAVHIPLRGTARVCKKLGIDFAEACVGFEFGNRRAVPVLRGVVVAQENHNLLMDAWREDERLRRAKEEQKRAKLVLGLWKKFYTGVKIMERMRAEYKDIDTLPDEANPFTNQKQNKKRKSTGAADGDSDSDPVVSDPPEAMDRGDFVQQAQQAGGFVRDADEEADGCHPDGDQAAGGFIIEDDQHPGGFFVDDAVDPHGGDGQGKRLSVPMSLQAAHQTKREPSPLEEGESVDDEPATSSKKRSSTKPKSQPRKKSTPRKRSSRIGSEPSDGSDIGLDLSESVDGEAHPQAAHHSALQNGLTPGGTTPKMTNDSSPRRPTDRGHRDGSMRTRRKAATRSAQKVTSHYFDPASDEGEETSSTTTPRQTRRARRARGGR